MTDQEYYNKTDDILSKFKNGKELYRKSPLFNRVVQMMAMGTTEFEAIEHLIQITEDTTKAMEQYIVRDTRPSLLCENPYK